MHSLPTEPSHRTCNCCVILNETKPRPGAHLRNWHQIWSSNGLLISCVWHCCGMSMRCQYMFVQFSSWVCCPSGTRIKCSQSSANFATIGSSWHYKLGVWLANYQQKAQESHGVLTCQKLKNCCQEWLVWLFRDVQSPRGSARHPQTSVQSLPAAQFSPLQLNWNGSGFQEMSRMRNQTHSSTYSTWWATCTASALHCTLQTGYNSTIFQTGKKSWAVSAGPSQLCSQIGQRPWLPRQNTAIVSNK